MADDMWDVPIEAYEDLARDSGEWLPPGLNDHITHMEPEEIKEWVFDNKDWYGRQIPEPLRSLIFGRDRKSMKRGHYGIPARKGWAESEED